MAVCVECNLGTEFRHLLSDVKVEKAVRWVLLSISWKKS